MEMMKFVRYRISIWVITVAIFGLLLRLILCWITPGNFDMESYQIVIAILRRGGIVYAETNRYNYSPTWSYILLALDWFGTIVHLPFSFVERGFISLVDIPVAVMIGMIANQYRAGTFLKGFAIYFLNPISILLAGVHGQFDNLATLPLLLALYLIRRPKPTHKACFWVLGTIALLTKQITLPGIWMLFAYLASPFLAFLGLGASFAILISTFLPFLPLTSSQIIQNVFLYSGIHLASYGFLTFLPTPLVFLMFMLVSILLPLVARSILRFSIDRALAFSFVTFLVFTPGIGIQYFLLPLIFSSYQPDWFFWIYTIVTTFFIVGNNANLNLPLLNIWNSVWLTLIFWFGGFLICRPISNATPNTNHNPP
jgi:hypothetical protein